MIVGRGAATALSDLPAAGGLVWTAGPQVHDRRMRKSSCCATRMRRGEGVQLGQLRPEAGVAGRGGAGDERLGDRPERAERLLGVRGGMARDAGQPPHPQRPAARGCGLTGHRDRPEQPWRRGMSGWRGSRAGRARRCALQVSRREGSASGGRAALVWGNAGEQQVGRHCCIETKGVLAMPQSEEK